MKKLEEHRLFPLIAIVLVALFAYYVYYLATNFEPESTTLSNDRDYKEAAVRDPMSI